MLFIDTVIKRSVCYRTVWSALTELKTPHQKNLQDTDHKLKPADVKSAKRAWKRILNTLSEQTEQRDPHLNLHLSYSYNLS